MALHEVRAAGSAYLALATQLLQRARLADPQAGLWEAADLQWWSRTPRRSDEVAQVFWTDDQGPVAGVILTDWGQVWGCDPIVVQAVPLEAIWARALDVLDALRLDEVETLVRDDDVELRSLVTHSGFQAGGESYGVCWMSADSRPDVTALPDGFALVDRARETARPHPMRARNGTAVEARLRQCSLYDPALDLAVQAPDGRDAGYALFWYDPVTAVGLVEPMRVEDRYQRRGLARALLAEGLDRLAKRGAGRLKVGYSTQPARALYEGAGFRVTASGSAYRRSAH